MIDQVEFETYRNLKYCTDIKYRGYILRYILATDYIYFAYDRSLDTVSYKNVLLNIFATPDLKVFKRELPSLGVMFTTANYGQDHTRLLDAIVDEIDDAIIIPKNARRLSLVFNLKNIVVSFREIFDQLKSLTSFKIRLYFFSRLVYYKKFIDELEKTDAKVNIRAYVSFLSCMTDDSIYCQFFKKRGVATYCIQHGAYASEIEYRNRIPLDVVNIENFQADYMLGWGDSMRTSMLRQGFQNEQFILAGNPKYKGIKDVTLEKSEFKSVIVCLARDFYLDENIQLLQIVFKLNSLGIDVFVKYHPRSNADNYDGVIEAKNVTKVNSSSSLKNLIFEHDIDFAIVYNSTVYYELYTIGIIPFRFEHNENDILFGLDDGFTDFHSLKMKIQDFKLRDFADLSRKATAMVNRFCCLGTNNYKDILS